MRINLDKNWEYTDITSWLDEHFTAARWRFPPRLLHKRCGYWNKLLSSFRFHLSDPKEWHCAWCWKTAPKRVQKKMNFIKSQ